MKILFLALFGIIHFDSFPELAHYAENSARLEQVLCQFRFIKDQSKSDEYINPIEFVKRGGGDCDDYATFVYTILRMHGYKCQIWILGGKKQEPKHAICAYEKQDDSGLFSNGTRYRKIKVKEFMKLKDYKTRKLKCQ